MTLKTDAKFEEKPTCELENDKRNLAIFLPEHSKFSKFGLWWEPFIQSRKCMSLKFTEETEKSCIMTMKNDAKSEDELICRFKTDRRNLTNFDPSTQKLKYLHLKWLRLNKVCVWAEKVQRSYVSWHWRLM